jgi:hypothetical protein
MHRERKREMLPSISELIEKGHGRSMTVAGDLSTGYAGGGAATDPFDIDQPQIVVGVPAGTFIKPIYADINLTIAESAADLDFNDILLAADVLGYWAVEPTPTAGNITHTPETPVNMRTSFGRGSACHCASQFVVDFETVNVVGTSADPALDMELARLEMDSNFRDNTGANNSICRLLYQPRHPAILVGPATLIGYWGGDVGTVGGYAIVQWVEGPTSMLGKIGHSS